AGRPCRPSCRGSGGRCETVAERPPHPPVRHWALEARPFGRFSRVSGLVTEVDGDDVVVRYADPEHAASEVRVWARLHLGDTWLHEVEGGWEVRLTDLPVDRLEYLLDVDGVMRLDA